MAMGLGQSFRDIRTFGISLGILFSSIGYFNGRGQSIPVMIQGVSSAFCIRIPVSIFMSRLP